MLTDQNQANQNIEQPSVPESQKVVMPAKPPVANVANIIGWVGLVILIFSTIVWIVAFPTFEILNYSFSGNVQLFQPTTATGIAAFCHNYPQVLWFSFVLGAGLFFGSGATAKILKSAPAELVPDETQPLELNLAGRSWKLPANTARIWHIAGAAGLAIILIVAANARIGGTYNIGDTNLIPTDYDEGVHSSAALLLAHGKSVYTDFFLTQPPVGPLIWSLPLRFASQAWGGLDDFMRLRLFTSLLSLITIGLVYLTGRALGGKWAGPIAGCIAALALAIDGEAVRTEQQIMLEPLVNLFTAAAICVFARYAVYDGPKRRQMDVILPILAGGFAGIAISVKIPALAVVIGLGLTLLLWRRWRATGFYVAGVVLGYLLLSNYFILTSGVAFFKQAYFYQLFRPFNNISLDSAFQSDTTLTAWDYMARTPYLAFTLLGAVIGLIAIVLRWTLRAEGRQWLPITLVAVFTCLLYTGKQGFFPHYYDHLALPLALLVGGTVNFWQLRIKLPQIKLPERVAEIALGVVGAIAVVVVVGPLVGHAGDDPSTPQWSLERAVDRSMSNLNLNGGSLMNWDARYSFITGRELPTDSYNKYMVDSAAYVEYLSLGLDGQSFWTVAQNALFGPKNDNDAMRDLRYTAVVQQDLFAMAQKSDYILIEDRAKSQLTPQTLQQFNQNFIDRQDSDQTTILSSAKFIQNQSGILFGSQMRLVGFDTPAQYTITPTDHKLPLTLFWRGETKIAQNYVIFIHLLNEQGQTVAQRDTAPRYGQFNTSQWTQGNLLDDDQSLDLATNLPPGRYKVEMGVYLPTDGKRLPITDAPDGETVSSGNDSIILFEVNILGL